MTTQREIVSGILLTVIAGGYTLYLALAVKEENGDAAGFECSNGWFLVTILAPADEFAQVKAVYDEYPQMLEQQFKQSMSEGMDSEAMMLLELARNNGYKVGVKFHAQGYKPIIISLE
jgi:hypothetical protein